MVPQKVTKQFDYLVSMNNPKDAVGYVCNLSDLDRVMELAYWLELKDLVTYLQRHQHSYKEDFSSYFENEVNDLIKRWIKEDKDEF